jgi:hypothetical protein
MDVESEWHGWSKGDLGALHVGPLPGRKSICVYTVQGTILRVHAYARSEDEARDLLKFLDLLLG